MILQEIFGWTLFFLFGYFQSFGSITCWYKRNRDVLYGIHSPLATFCLTFRKFWLCLIVFVQKIYFKDVFLRKAMTDVALNTFPNILLIFNIYQCLFIISLIFVKVGLYVTENGVSFSHTILFLFNRAALSSLSTFSI